MKHEEIVSLTHKLRGYCSRLLRDEQTPESVLSTFFGPLDEDRLSFAALPRQNCLRLLHDRNGIQELTPGPGGEVRLVPLKDLVHNQGSHPPSMDGSHKRDVDNDDVSALEVPEYSIEHPGVLVVKPLDDWDKVVHDRRRRGFGDILDDFSYLPRIGVISVGFQEFYQLRPFMLLQTSDCIGPD